MMDVAAVVLAGGGSRRMGRDKAALVLGGRTLLQRAVDAVAPVAEEVVVVGAPGRALPPLRATRPPLLVSDEVEGEGPLAGMVTGLARVRAAVVLVVACDLPFVRPALLRLLAARAADHPAVVPVVEGRPQPLCSAVRVEVLAQLRAALARGTRAASALADVPGALLLAREAWSAADPEALSFVGVNTPEEFARAEALAARLG